MEAQKVIVDTPAPGNWGRFKSWVKLVTGIDGSRSNGYCFEGEFLNLNDKAEVEVGSFILCYDERGSRKHHYPTVTLYQVTPKGTLKQVYEKEDIQERSWALTVRDDIAEIVEGKQEANPLDGFSNEELLAEVQRRGLQ